MSSLLDVRLIPLYVIIIFVIYDIYKWGKATLKR